MPIERERRRVLAASGLLEQTTDERLQALVKTAALALGATICYVNIIGDGVQTHVASYPPHDLGGQDALDQSACKTVAETREPLIVEDARTHPVLCSFSRVIEGEIEAYLGIPIWVGEVVVGALCVIDTKPRNWGYFERQSLIGFADLAGLSVEKH